MMNFVLLVLQERMNTFYFGKTQTHEYLVFIAIGKKNLYNTEHAIEKQQMFLNHKYTYSTIL